MMGGYDSFTSWHETPDFMKNKRGQRSPNKKKEAKESHQKKKKREKMREKERRTMLLSFYHTCALEQHHVLHIESLLSYHFHILVGIFNYRTWLVYSYDGLPQNALGLHEQASWMHTHQFLLLSFHTFIALVHLLHGNPYSSC